MKVKVKAIFNTSLGVIAILDFPSPLKPAINMNLRKGDCIYLIKGISFEQPNQFEKIENTEYPCLLSVGNQSIDIGDILEIIESGS